MVKVGDLVKRIAVLSVIDNEFGWVLTDEYPDDIGIVIAVEEPDFKPSRDYNESVLSSGFFIKVMWQSTNYGGPVWHWSEELSTITENKPLTP